MIVLAGVAAWWTTRADLPGGDLGDLPARCASYAPTATPDPADSLGRAPPALEERYPDIVRPGSRLDLHEVNLAQTLQQVRRFRPVDEFELPSSGMVAVVRSDGPLVVNKAAVDELLHAHLRLSTKHTDSLLRARMQCYADAILRDQAFAGAVVNIYVPSDPGMCIRALRLVKRLPQESWRRSCHWAGATPPVQVSTFIADVRMLQFHVLVAPGLASWTTAHPTSRPAALLRHESDHLWDWVMGQRYDPLPNEMRARMGDDLVRDYYRDVGIPMPTPFLYADDALSV